MIKPVEIDLRVIAVISFHFTTQHKRRGDNQHMLDTVKNERQGEEKAQLCGIHLQKLRQAA